MEEVKYKFTAISINDSKEVFPQNGNTLAVSWEKEEENAYFRKKLKGKMLFTGEDFHWLYIYESSQYRCDAITLIVEKRCSDAFTEFFVARLILNNADWDLDQCTATIEAEVEDRYTCFNDNKDKEYNLINIASPKVVVSLVKGTLEYQSCSGNEGDPQWCGAGDQSDGWTVLRFYQRNPNPDFPDPDPHDTTFDITWVREVITSTEPLGAPWIEIGVNQYARQPALYGYRSFGGQYDTGYEYKVGGTIDNGMPLKIVVQALIDQGCFGMKVKSKFFNWDPDPQINKNIFNYRLSDVGAKLSPFGYIISDPNPFNKVTPLMRVIPETELWLNNASIIGSNNWFYDVNKNPVSVAPSFPGGLYVKLADIPANVHYVRYEYFDDTFPGAIHGTDLMFYMGTGEIPFEVYDDSNYVTGEKSKVDNLILFQKSDVKRPDGSGNASISNITLEKLIKDLCNMFNLKWDIDEDGDFIIEHVSFFQKGVGLDLVGRRDSNLREGMRKYTYDIDNMPRKEVFQMMDDKYSYGDFKGVPIIYSNSCVGQGEKEDKDWIVENIMTDVNLALNNSGSDSQIVSDDGFVLIACDENNNILSEASIMSGSNLNNPLSWAHLHYDYWRYERVFNRFSMNNVQTDALSVVPTKKQVKINVSLCCGEVFDPEELVNTELGEGQVSEALFDLHQELLTLTLLYSAEQELVTNDPPVAEDDIAITWVGLTIDIDVLANDTDSDGTINPGTLTITFGGAHGTSVVIGGKIRYTPNPGYVGDDLIVYNVKDNWSEVSNNGNVNVTVKPGSPLPIANNDSYSTGENTVLTVGSVLSNDTGDGTIEAVPEIKATEEGGSVQIYANGSFVYTPPTDYLGEDGFDYTLKDSNDNTDTGHVTITVFEKEDVFVKYAEVNPRNVNMEMGCEGEGEGDPPTNEVVGNQDLVDQVFEYYSDLAGTIPLDVTGYGLLLKMRRTRTGTGADVDDYDVSASGFNGNFEGVVVSETYYGCPFGGGADDTAFDDTYELLTSPDYTII